MPIISIIIFLTILNVNSSNNFYDPGVLNNFSEAFEVYDRMRTDFKENAQCTHMAHVWAYEEFKRSGLKSKKIFLFFSRSYIRKYKYQWWFHVSPLVYVKNGEEKIKIVLDRGYTAMPLELKKWTDQFVKSNRECKMITSFKNYLRIRDKTKEHCFLMEESMYYWLPRDMRRREEQGIEKKRFKKSELDYSYQKAFKEMIRSVN